jgi:hypothetical protein
MPHLAGARGALQRPLSAAGKMERCTAQKLIEGPLSEPAALDHADQNGYVWRAAPGEGSVSVCIAAAEKKSGIESGLY